MVISTKRSYSEMLQEMADEYLKETGKVEATTSEIAQWAITSNRWEPPRDLVHKRCCEDIARAMREQHVRGDNGQLIRAKHVARVTRGGKQLHLWADIRKAPRSHMEVAFQQRREQIVGDCRQLKRDIDYYNDIAGSDRPIQMVFDFRDDIEEGEFSGEYPTRRP